MLITVLHNKTTRTYIVGPGLLYPKIIPSTKSLVRRRQMKYLFFLRSVSWCVSFNEDIGVFIRKWSVIRSKDVGPCKKAVGLPCGEAGSDEGDASRVVGDETERRAEEERGQQPDTVAD